LNIITHGLKWVIVYLNYNCSTPTVLIQLRDILQSFHLDGVGTAAGCLFIQLFHIDRVDTAAGCFYNNFTPIGLIQLRVVSTIISPRWGWYACGLFIQLFHLDGVGTAAGCFYNHFTPMGLHFI
jgi:hypothetical protein